MAYIHTLPDYPAFEKLFNDAGYKLEVDLANCLIIEKEGIDDWIEYDQLPKYLQKAMDKFANKHKLEN